MARDFDWNKALKGELGEEAKKNTEWLKGLADELDAIAAGELYTDGDGTFWMHVEGYNDNDTPEGWEDGEWEPADMYGFLAENYGMTYTLNDDLEVTGCTVLMAWGGPNIYVDTNKEMMEMHWWNQYACYPLSDRAVSAVNDFAREIYGMKKGAM